jgi:excisionase family DNA binding protein
MSTNRSVFKTATVNVVRASREQPHISLHGDTIVANRGLLRIEEAAQWLGLGRTKAYELVFRGTLPSVRIGRSRRIAVSALEAFVEGLVETAKWRSQLGHM